MRAANDRFQDVAKAVAEGYAAIPCASSPTGGAMGIHYVNANYLKDDAVDVARPEAVMYEPMADGTPAWVAVEYITSRVHEPSKNPPPQPRPSLTSWYGSEIHLIGAL